MRNRADVSLSEGSCNKGTHQTITFRGQIIFYYYSIMHYEVGRASLGWSRGDGTVAS